MSEVFTAAFWAKYGSLLLNGTRDTLVMVVVSTVFAYLLGLPLGVALILTQPHGIRPNRIINRILGWIINIGRSLPFIILMIAIMDFTKLIVGTKIGVKGAIVPLVVSAAPFIARMVETSLSEVDAGVIEAAQSMGASTFQIVWKVYLPEAKPSLVLGGAISIVTILAYTAIAGAVGAGGLGDLAIRYGYQRKVPSMMLVTVVLLIVLVQIIQYVFSRVSARIDKRLDQNSKGSFAPLELLARFTHTK
jgi:D-methionine transport system permease protein